eukprot:5114165-Prymnesium_polylepis.2
MSACSAARKLDPARRTPAANAPVAVESPSALAACPMPRATRSAAATKVSVERVEATRRRRARRCGAG